MNTADIIAAILSIVTVAAGADLYRYFRNSQRLAALQNSMESMQEVPAAEVVKEHAHYSYPATDRNAVSFWAY